MSYITVTTIVDGVLHDERDLAPERVEAYLAEQERAAKADGLPTEIYALTHDHDPTDEECDCIQYAQDHRPIRSYNVTEERP